MRFIQSRLLLPSAQSALPEKCLVLCNEKKQCRSAAEYDVYARRTRGAKTRKCGNKRAPLARVCLPAHPVRPPRPEWTCNDDVCRRARVQQK